MSKPSIAVYPISAQPPTWGHGDILKRAAASFDKLFWVAALNSEKKLQLSLQSQIAIMKDYVNYYKLPNVEIDHFSGSIARYALDKGARFLIRGVRHCGDLEHEMALSAGYRGITDQVEVIAFFSAPEFSRISSSLVRELARLGEELSPYVLPAAIPLIIQAFGPNSYDLQT